MIDITHEYLAQQGLSATFPKRFWDKVEKTDGCWLWTGATHVGYGQIQKGVRGNGLISAHVASWVLHYGPLPPGKWVLHTCDNHPCVRPDHLFTGTQLDNMRDMVAKGRANHPLRKLTPERIQEMFHSLSDGVPQTVIASRLGVCQQLVSRAKNGLVLKHFTPNRD